MVGKRRFYVYLLTYPNGRPFYIGKGTGRRIDHHEKEARRGHLCHKCKVIRQIWREDAAVGHSIVLETADEQEALDYEITLIEHYGAENLTNESRGGEGRIRGEGGNQTERQPSQRLQYRLHPSFDDFLAQAGCSVRGFARTYGIPHQTLFGLIHPEYNDNRRGGMHYATGPAQMTLDEFGKKYRLIRSNSV